MKNQILRGLTMLLLVAAVAVMAALVSAHAQSSVIVMADVPFEFAVGNTSLKAGEYTVRAMTANGDALLINSRDSSESAIRLSNPIRSRDVQEKGKLVFHRYGERYFLSEVWTPGEQTGRQLRKSSAERAIESQLAAIPSKSDLARTS
jgi:hypothetical protein